MIWSQRESASMSLAVMRVPIHANVVVEDTEELGLHHRPHRAPATTQHRLTPNLSRVCISLDTDNLGLYPNEPAADTKHTVL